MRKTLTVFHLKQMRMRSYLQLQLRRLCACMRGVKELGRRVWVPDLIILQFNQPEKLQVRLSLSVLSDCFSSRVIMLDKQSRPQSAVVDAVAKAVSILIICLMRRGEDKGNKVGA